MLVNFVSGQAMSSKLKHDDAGKKQKSPKSPTLNELLCGQFPDHAGLFKLPADELVMDYRNGVQLLGSITTGALVLTSFRVLFLPGFVDAERLVQELVGSGHGIDLKKVGEPQLPLYR